MSSQSKPIKAWGQGGPNPPKVAIILEELGLPYEEIFLPLSNVKNPEYLAINPNGRIPAIEDPNTGITLWESGAIIEYLIEHYDTKHQISFTPGTPESYHAKQWLFFASTGQGPAIERYNEVNRVSGVLDGWLAQQEKEHGGPWLVGNKMSYADLAFITYQRIIGLVLENDAYNEDDFPHVKEWLQKMTSRQTVKTVLEKAQAAQAASH